MRFSGLAAGNYTVTIKDLASVKGTTTVTIAVDTNLTADAGSDLLYCAGTSRKFAATSNGTGFSWTPATGLDNAATCGYCGRRQALGILLLVRFIELRARRSWR